MIAERSIRGLAIIMLSARLMNRTGVKMSRERRLLAFTGGRLDRTMAALFSLIFGTTYKHPRFTPVRTCANADSCWRGTVRPCAMSSWRCPASGCDTMSAQRSGRFLRLKKVYKQHIAIAESRCEELVRFLRILILSFS